MRVKQNRDEISAATAALFSELREAYGRVEKTLPPLDAPADPGAHGRFLEECNKASALVRRIRELRQL
jgi:hypothetical protein